MGKLRVIANKPERVLSLLTNTATMPKKLVLLFCALLHLPTMQAQKLLEFKPFDTTAYVYRLNKAQMDYLVQRNGITDTAFLFTNLYKKFPRSSNYTALLPHGNFLAAHIDQSTVSYTYLYSASFDIKHKVIGNDVILFIKDKKTRQNLASASVYIGDLLVPFNAGYGGYAFHKNDADQKLLAKGKLLLHVTLGEEYFVTRYTFINGYQGPPPSRQYRGNWQSQQFSGYCISDKPVYRPGDTVHIKAFLSHPRNGKPLKRKAILTLQEPQQNFVYTKTLKPVSPGAFVFNWKIPDTLKIDRNFNMTFGRKIRSRWFYRQATFYLENYTLNANRYEATVLKNEVYPGEDLRFQVRATDANGFPLQGTQVHYKLSINGVSDFYGDTLMLSAAKRANYFEHDTVYPYEDGLTLKIPAALLPNMDAYYGLEVTLTDPSTFEQKTFPLNFSRIARREKFLAYQQADSVFVRFLLNGRDTAQTYQLVSLSNNDTLFKKDITTPYHFQLSPYNTAVVFLDKAKTPTWVNVTFNRFDIAKVKGERSADSIRIAFSFPFEEAIHYRILKNDKVVQQGQTKKLDFRIADNTKDPYTLLFTSNLNNAIENNYYRITYTPPLHKIKLHTNLPAQAFPGQKLLVNIKATDCYNTPLRNVNIAAFALNKQFEDRFVTPEISVPLAFRDAVSLSSENSTDQIQLNINQFYKSVPLSARSFTQFELYNNEYYQLRYPRGTHAVLSKPIQSPLPEFALSVTSHHTAYTPKYILLDGEPVYISDLDEYPYSFQASAGPHQLTFRFFNRKVVLNTVFEANKKYWLGFHVDSLKTTAPNLLVVDTLPVAQPDEAEKRLLYNTLLLTNPFSYDSLQLKAGNDLVFVSNNRVRRHPKSLNVDGDYFYVFGPLRNTRSANLRVNKKTFALTTSPEYVHYFDPLTQEFTSKHRGPVKGVVLGFGEVQLDDNHLLGLQVPDVVKPEPEKVSLNLLPDVSRALQRSQEPEYTQQYYASGSGYFSVCFKNNNQHNWLKALWLINKTKPEESQFVPLGHPVEMNCYTKQASEGDYDLYFLMNNARMAVLRGVHFHTEDALYVNPFALKTDSLTVEKLASPLKVYNDLTKLPLLPFYFPPEESAETLQETKDPRRQKTYLHGYVTNEALQPLPNVMVMAEVNGKFMYGALTNAAGEYEVLNLLPGSYQLKFYHPGFQIKTYATAFLKQGHSYELHTSLKDVHLQKPLLETIRQDFRFMVFAGNKRANLMKLNVYDKDTREALRDFTLTLYEEYSNVAEKTIKGSETLELAFPPQANVYRLEIRCKGYVPVVFHNVRFSKNSLYALYLFAVSEKENPWLKKKEYDLQLQHYPREGEMFRREMYAIDRNSYLDYDQSVGSAAGTYNREEYQNLASKDVEYKKTRSHSLDAMRIQKAPPQTISDLGSPDLLRGSRDLMEVEITGNTRKGPVVSDDLVQQVMNTKDLNHTRKNFSDVAYWQPNHLTNKNGEVSFEIRLPDNTTTWKSNILAMGKNHLHGLDTSEIRAFKPLQTSALVPPFLWLGDKVWAKAKFTNLTSEAKNITASLWVNDSLLRKNNTLVKNYHVDSVLLQAKTTGPLPYKASLQFEEKYKDEEQRTLNVYSPAFRFYTNQTVNMDRDSTYRLTCKDGTRGEIVLNNSLYEKIVEEINVLDRYEYTCVEQVSSQLRALLCKEKINRALQSKENLNPRINRLVQQLANYQNKNGTWGWWKRQPTNWRMTIYATEALSKANSNGYYSPALAKGIRAIKTNFAGLSTSEQLYGYAVLQRLGEQDGNLKKLLQTVDPLTLPAIDRFYYYKVKEADGETVAPTALYSVYLELNNQLHKHYYGDFFYEPRANLLSAYNLFSGSAAGSEWLQLFKRKLLNGQLDKDLNTYSKTQLIEALTASVENTDNKPITAQVVVNDTLTINTFPYRFAIARNAYTLRHSGATVFVNTAEETFTDTPRTADSLFKVKVQFVQNGQASNRLQAGKPCQLHVVVDAYRSFDYVMVEIPVPSGMRFVSKTQLSGCAIEYYPNKVVVFYEKLRMQQHQLTFDMLPVFRGNFVWPAAKCSLMYYPYLFGNNQMQALEVH